MSHGDLTKPRRIIDRKYREWIKTKPCVYYATGEDGKCLCSGPIDAMHLTPRNGTKSAASKVSDYRCLPGCRGHHEEFGSGNPVHLAYLEALIERFNKEYLAIMPTPAVQSRKKQAKGRISIQACEACSKNHTLTRIKITDVNLALGRVTFLCPLKNEISQASI